MALAGHHVPERHAKRVQIRADVHANSRELLRTGKLGCPGKSPGRLKSQLQQPRSCDVSWPAQGR